MRRLTITALALGAVACTAGAATLVVASRPADASVISTAFSPAPAARTPAWSARRVPEMLTGIVETTARNNATFALTRELQSIVAPVHGCVAVDGPFGAIARVASETALAPASTLKLLTATTAIARLGPDHRFTTRAVLDGEGDLVVIGGGDPLLATDAHIAYRHGQLRFRNAPVTPLSKLADAIVAAGVRRVRGALLVDDTAHEHVRFLPGWKTIYSLEGDVGSLGALTVDGGYSQPNDTIASPDPAITTGQELAALLAARGVTIAKGIAHAGAEEGGRDVGHVVSPPLSAVVGEMLTSSDNYTAEEILRDLVMRSGARPATTAAGILTVEGELGALGVPTTGLVMHDGSGLTPADRVTCTTMLEVMKHDTEPDFAAVDLGLPIAGHTGTLAARFVGSPLAGRLRAKTGSIDGVVGLVGVIDGPQLLRFAFLANGGFSEAVGADLQQRIATVVGSTPDLRVPPDLVPPP